MSLSQIGTFLENFAGKGGKEMDYNPNLKPWRRSEPNQVAGKGRIEHPNMSENLTNQTRSAPPTEYENQLGDALMEIFESDIDQLSGVVDKLNEMGVKSPEGEVWTEESFQLEMKRLGA